MTASLVEALDFFAAHRVDCLVMDGEEDAADRIRELVASGTPVIFYDNDVPRPRRSIASSSRTARRAFAP